MSSAITILWISKATNLIIILYSTACTLSFKRAVQNLTVIVKSSKLSVINVQCHQ